MTRDGETILAGRATSLCLSAIGIDDQQREIRTRVACWLAPTRGAEPIVPPLERIVATRENEQRLPTPSERSVATITASSTLGSAYGTEDLSDGDPATAWCEGDAFLGIGATLALTWTEPVDPLLTLLPGYHRDKARLLGNGAPRRLLATTDPGVVRQITLPRPGAPSIRGY